MKVTPQEILDALREALPAIESGKARSFAIHFDTTDGQHHHHDFKLDTQEERDIAAASIRKILGDLH